MPPPTQRKTPVRQPKQRRSQDTVNTILYAGARILAEAGWSRFNTNAIAARAGVSIGSVYEYFESKQVLVDAIASAHLARGEDLLARASARIAHPVDLEELAGILVRGMVALHAEDPRLHRVLSSEAPLSAPVRARAERLRLHFVDVVARVLDGRTKAPRLAAQLLVDTTDAAVHRWWVDDDGGLAEPQQLAAELERMVSAYLREARPMDRAG